MAMLLYQMLPKPGWWFLKYVLFSALFGEGEPILTNKPPTRKLLGFCPMVN